MFLAVTPISSLLVDLNWCTSEQKGAWQPDRGQGQLTPRQPRRVGWRQPFADSPDSNSLPDLSCSRLCCIWEAVHNQHGLLHLPLTILGSDNRLRVTSMHCNLRTWSASKQDTTTKAKGVGTAWCYSRPTFHMHMQLPEIALQRQHGNRKEYATTSK